MTKGKRYTTEDNMDCVLNTVASDPSITTKLALVRKISKKQGISYATANYAIKRVRVNYPRLFERFEEFNP